ncbi:MAG: patatin-like phospholipase family protein, partial [Pseudomonadales bacterium]|nr:patatin-like phospholipase family protein [Pseudomonadales bacterium]
ILASGSLPVYMRGITGLGTAGDAVFRDGGLLDYHPVPANVLARSDGLVLYPHFFPHLVERWFDKFYPWRKVPGSRLGDVVLVSPSVEFTRSLPQGRIPDRKDFLRFQRRDDERIALWQRAAERSHELGESFLELVRSGDIARVVTRLPG